MKIKFLLLSLMISLSTFSNQIRINKNIQSAINHSKNGDTIYVEKGIYREGNININKSIHLIGIDYPEIDACSKHENISVRKSHSSIKGFRIINTGYSSMDDMAGIKMYSVRDVCIENNILENTFFGIYFINSMYCKVRNNQITGPKNREQNDIGNGIHFWKCSYNLISGNSISQHRDGIYFEFVRNTVITGNISKNNNRYGLHFMFSDSDYYYKNTFIDNGAGVAVMYSKSVNMLRNKFIHNWGASAYGLLLKDIRDSYILGNEFKTNTVGIHAEGCSRSLVFGNNFENNGYALRLQADCDDNKIHFNNFILNSFDLITNGFTVLNELKFNYWDKYQGYDLKRDGIGDQAYRPMNLFGSIIEKNPVSILFLKSLLADILDNLEKIIPGITPENLQDVSPQIHRIVHA